MHNEREDMSREAFEAWYAKNHRGVISSTPKEDAQQAWQAAQAEAYERAAKVCKKIAGDPEHGDFLADGAIECEKGIRALAKESNS